MQLHDALFPILFWSLAIYLWRRSSWQKENWRDRRVLGARVFAICMAISLTIQAHPIGMYFDAALGLNNLSWVLGYSNAVVGVYAGTSAIVSVRKRVLPRWLSLVSIAALTAFVLLMPFLLAIAEEPHNQLPRSFPMLLLRETLYVFLLISAAFCFRTFRRWIQEEEHPTGRLRGSILIIAFGSAIFFAVLRGLSALIVYSMPEWSGYGIALRLSDSVLILCIVASVLGLAPVSWLRVPIQLAGYIEQHRALRDLERIRTALVLLTGRVRWAQPSYADRWFNLPFVLYCVCIDILDRRILLQAQLTEGTTVVTDEHRRIAKLLEELPDTPDWIDLVQHFRQVAREI